MLNEKALEAAISVGQSQGPRDERTTPERVEAAITAYLAALPKPADDVAELARWLRELADPMCEAMPDGERLTQFVHASKQAAAALLRVSAELFQSRNFWSEELSKANATIADRDAEITRLKGLAARCAAIADDLARDELFLDEKGRFGAELTAATIREEFKLSPTLSDLERRILNVCAGGIEKLPYNKEQREAEQRLVGYGFIARIVEDDQPTCVITDAGRAARRALTTGGGDG